MRKTQLPPIDFATREDAAWLLLGFLIFSLAWALAIVSMRATGGSVRLGVAAPVIILLVLSAAVLEVSLRRLHTQLTGRTLSPWPFGLVSMSTLAVAISPSTMSDAAARVGLNGRLVAGLIYGILIADVVALTILLI